MRAEARSLRDRPFVEAARAIGVPAWRILPRHILRNCLTPVLVQATVDVGSVVLAAGSLAFIGLGAQPPAPDWGLMVAEGRGQIFTAWWISTFPGLAIFADRPRLQSARRLAARLLRSPAGEAMTDHDRPSSASTTSTIAFEERGALTNRPVRGITLSVGPREVVGIVGETGCGKSLTGLAVLGLLPKGAVPSGRVLLDGIEQPFDGRGSARGDAISIVFQNPGTAFNPVFTLGRQMRDVVDRHRRVDGTAAASRGGEGAHPALPRTGRPARRPNGSTAATRTSCRAACCSAR